MSSAQMRRLTFRAVVPILTLAVPLAGLIAMAFAAHMFYPLIASRVRLMLAFGNYVVAFAGAMVFGFIALVINLILHSERLLLSVIDLASGKVAGETGRLLTSKSEEIQDGIDQILRRKTLTHSFVMRGHFYQVDESAYDALIDYPGTFFRIYYTPRSRFLLAAEPAVPDANSPN
jgi:hypothetical protein